ncbi:MAG: hypothetical protein ABI648_07340 [Betaproteobacteria bacterium]|jgi:hypothetical protein
MNASKLLIAAGFAIASTGAFAETGVTTYQIDHVANVYGRASAPNVQLVGADTRGAGSVDSAQSATKIAVKAGKDVDFGRS